MSQTAKFRIAHDPGIKFGRRRFVASGACNGALSSVGGRPLDALDGVYRQDGLLPLQFETELAKNREDCG